MGPVALCCSVNFKRLRIPQATTSDQRLISNLVQKCLDAKGVECEQWEREIDERVAELYGVSLKKIKAKA